MKKCKNNHKKSSKFILEELEPRVLFSGGIEGLIATELEPAIATYIDIDTNPDQASTQAEAQSTASAQQVHEIVFVDTGVEGYQTLVDDIVNNADSTRNFEVVLLDSNQNGIEQISDTLLNHDELDAIHIISHGEDGNIQLGNTSLNSNTLAENQLAITLWADSFTESGDILIYGCNLTETKVGQNLIQSLSELTKTEIAASDNITGVAQLGGDWDLEFQTGIIETSVVINQNSQLSWVGTLDTSTGLVGHWVFDTDATDSSGSNDGTLTNGAAIDTTSTTNIVGDGKLSLDGTNDYVDLDSHISSFSGLNEGTISAWIKTTDTTESTIFGLSDKNDSLSLIKFGIELDGRLKWLNYNDTVNDVVGYSTQTVNDGLWHHVAITVNSSGNTLYIDGKVANATYSVGSTTTQSFFNDITNIDKIDIGHSVRDSTIDGFFDGQLDDVRVYNRALTTSDIANLYNIPTNITLAQATSITIANPGFEAQTALVDGDYSETTITDWSSSANANTVVWNPPTNFFTKEAPEGQNAAYVKANSVGDTISQVLSDTFEAGRSYILSAMVGDESNADNATGWEMRLYAGGQLLGSVSNSDFAPGNDEFIKATLHLDADTLATYAASYGSALEIQFHNIGDPASVDYVNFDDVQLEYTAISVSEVAANGTVVATVANSTDADGYNPDIPTHTYSLSNNAGGRFAINSSGVITVADRALLVHSTNSSHNITIRSTDTAGLTYDEVVTIQVAANNAPTDLITSGTLNLDTSYGGISVPSLSLDNRTAFTVEMEINPARIESSNWSYTLVAQNNTWDTNGFFLTVDDGKLDYSQYDSTVWQGTAEASVGDLVVDNWQTVTVTLDASGTAVIYVEGVQVAITTGLPPIVDSTGVLKFLDGFDGDVREIRVFDTALSSAQVATSLSTDYDGTEAGLLLLYDFEDGTGSTVTDLSPLNHHGTIADPSTTNWITIQGVAENSTENTVVGFLSAIDPDAGDALTYSIVNDPSNNFKLVGREIQVKVGATLDYEAASSHDITVRVTDSGGLFHEEIVTIQVTDVNEAPVASADPSSYNATVQGLSPVGYWTLGETSGTAAVDSGSTANNGIYNGTTGATGAAGAINNSGGNAAEFNGTDDYIEIAHHNDYLLDNGAIQLWFNADNLAANQTLISKDSNGFDTGGQFYIRLLTSGEIEVRLQSTTASNTITTSGAGITAGNWHNIALTFGDQGMQLYLDGEKVGDNAYTGGLGTTSGGTGNFEPLVIGANTFGSGDLVATPLSEYFDGKIDEVALIGSQITAQQVKQLYGAGIQLQDYTIVEGGTLTINATEGVLTNDFDPEDDALTLSLISGPAYDSSFTLNADGSFSYTHDGSESFSDSFVYQIDDGNGGIDTATVTITITPVNDAPELAITSTFIAYTENSAPVTIDSTLILTDDDSSTISGATIEITNFVSGQDVLSVTDSLGITSSWDAVSGILSLTGDTTAANYQIVLRTITYQNTSEDPNITPRLIELKATDDENAISIPVIRSISVNSVYDRPETNDVSASGVEDTSSIAITLTATDVDSTIQEYQLNSLPSNGTLYTDSGLTTVATTGTFYAATGEQLTLYFVPDNNWNGDTTFQFTAKDGGLADLTPATATITVTSVNDAPVNTVPGTQTIIEETLTAITGISINDIDAGTSIISTQLTVNNGILNVTLAGSASITVGENNSGTILLSGNITDINATLNSLKYKGNNNVAGINSDTLTILTSDLGGNGTGGSLTDSDSIQIDITNVNDAPVLDPIGNQSVAELATLSFTASATDADLPADTLTYTLDAASLALGMTIDASTGVFSWTPSEIQGGLTPSVTITVTDSGTGTLFDAETFTITVGEINTPPVLAAIGNQSVAELATLSFTASATDADLPADTLTYTLDAASIALGMTIDASTGVFSWTPSEIQGGLTPSVTITVTDSGSSTLTDSETFTITVGEINTPPVLAAIGNQSVAELATLSFTASATDADLPADTLTYTLDAASLALGMTIDANTGVFSWTPSETQGGLTPSVTITVTDSGTGTLFDAETFTITVGEINTPPVLAAIGNQSVAELATLSFTASATDADLPADTLTYTLDAASLALGMTIDANTGVFSWTPSETQGGLTPSVTITVTDSGTGTLFDAETFTITVGEINTPPVLAAIGNQSVAELATLSFTASATDADLPADTLTYTLDAASLALGMTIDANTGVFSWTPSEIQGGLTPSVTITVTDSGTGTLFDAETFTITVGEINTPPVLAAIGNQSVAELATLSFTASATDADLPADTLTYTLDAASLALGMTIDASTGVFSWTPSEIQGGLTPSVTITVTDSGTGTLFDAETFTITVGEINTPPVLAAIGNQSVAELATLSFTASATDADLPADTLTYTLDAASLALGMTIDANTGVFSWTPSEIQGGLTPSVTITVTDSGTGTLFDAETFTITVGEINTPPVLAAIGNQSVAELATLSFTASATDADLPADTLTYTLDAASIALGMTIDASTGVFSWTPTETQGGLTPSVTITVTDSGSSTLTDSETFTITVGEINTPPVLAAIGNQSVAELATLSFTASATDADLPADTLTYTLDAASLALGMSIDANTGVFSWTPSETQGGLTPSVTITVTDSGTGTLFDAETFTITVGEINTPPVLAAIGNQSVAELATLSFTASATDADLPADTLTYTLDAASLALGMTIDANTGVFSWTPSEIQGGLTPSVTITVTDSGTGTLFDAETFTITVGEINTPPVLAAIGNQSVAELATLSFTASATDADLPADTLTYTLDAASLALGMTIDANTGVFSWTPSETQGGLTPSVTITVTDSGTGTLFDAETFTITVGEINTPPVLAAIGNQSVAELATLSFTASATDADLPADTLTYTLDAASLALGMTIDASTGVFSWTPSEIQGGLTPSVTITVTDSGTGTLFDAETFTITVGEINTPPVLTAIGNQSVAELATLSFTASATDADLPADTLTYTLDAASLALGMTIDASTGVFSWTPSEIQGGLTPSVTITVTDSGTGTLFDAETFTITVGEINTPPVLAAIGNQSVAELATLSFTASATDADLPADTLTYTLDAASLALGMTIDASTGVFSWTPSETQGGLTPSVTITVTDSGTGTLFDAETFTITVGEINTPPVLAAIGNQSVAELATLSFTASATDADLPADTLTYTLDAASLALGMTIDASTGVFSWTPSEIQGGLTPSVTITVTDSGTGTLFDAETFTITVGEINTPPVLAAIGNQSVAELATLSFTASATDADLPADTLTYTLDAASLALGMTIDASTGVFSWTPSEIQGGLTPSVTITVTDSGTGTLFDAETFTITVGEINTPPVLTAIGNQSVAELATLSFTASATDADLPADTLTYTLDAASLALGMTIDASTGVFSWTPSEIQGGLTPSVTITVTDSGTGTLFDAETFTITVGEINTPPVLTAIGNQSVAELATLSFTASATDADLPADTLTYTLDAASLALGMTIDASTGVFSWTPSEIQGGLTPSVTITVTDSGTGTLFDAETFTITVGEINTPPVLAAIGNQSVAELATLSFTASATDADLPADTLTYTLDAASLALGMTIDASTGVFSWTPSEIQGGLTPSVTITVTDSGTGTLFDAETFTITVGEINTPPVLAAIGNQSVAELATLSFTASATDADLPADTLTYTLDAASLALGMTIDASTGVFSWTPSETQGGLTPSVTITVTDSGTGTLFDAETFTITVGEINTPPVLAAIGNQSVAELATLSFTASATDADLPADTLTYTLDAASLALGMTIDASTGVFSWTPSETQGGLTPSVTITVTDSGTGTLFDAETFTITVGEINTPPVLAAIGNQSVAELATLSFTASATDADLPADTLTYTLDAASLALGMTIDASTGVFSWTPSETQGGLTPSVTITVTDSGTGTLFDAETFTITVGEINTPPVLAAIGNQSVAELATLSFTASATDADLPADTLTYTLDAASLALGMTIDASTGVFSWTPSEIQGGLTPSVTITVTDSGTGTLFDAETFTITVGEINTPPVLTAIGNQSVAELATLSFTASATDADLPADTLTYTLDAASLALGMTIDASTGVFSWTPSEIQGGLTPSVTITVTDSGTGTLFDAETFTITVGEINTPPVLTAIGNQSVAELATLSFTASATDADLPADTLTYTLDAASLALGMSIDANTGVFSWTPSETQGGLTPSVTITVTDSGTGTLFDAETFTITVGDLNTAPVLDAIGNQSVAELATLSFTASATDADLPADTLTYTLDAASLALGMTIDASTGVFSWTPSETQGGLTPSVTITVTDSGSGTLTDSETFTITVVENILVISGIDTGIITENVSKTSGTLTLSYNQPSINPSLNGANFIAETIVGTHGSLTIDAFGHWNYIINDLATTQQLGVGERIFDTFTVSTNDGILHDVIITLEGPGDVHVSSPFPSDSDKTSLFGFYTSDFENISNKNTDLNSLNPTASLANSLHKISSIVPDESTPLLVNFSENKFHLELEKSIKKTESVIQDEIVQQKKVHKPKQIQILLDQLSNKSIFDFNIDTENDFDTEEEQALWDRIDRIRHQMDDSITSSEDNIDVQIVLGTSISLTAGFVSWFLRGGALLTSLMSTMPFMNRFDPLPILKSRRSKKQPIFDNNDKNKKPSDDNRKLRKFFNRKK